MKSAAIEIQSKVDELLSILDRDIEHIQESILRLNEMRELVIKRDDVSLNKLVECIRAESENYAANEKQRQSIRKEIAAILGCGVEQMTLSRIEDILTGEKKSQVAQKKTKLRQLTRELGTEHLSTALLLSECARLNGLLLKSILNLDKTAVCYNSSGSAEQRTDAAFMNLRF